MKRFYRTAEPVPVEGGFGVRLDGKALRTPGKGALVLPNAALAEAIAEEWRGQADEVRPDTMPMMRLASIGIDIVRNRRPSVIEEVAKYAETDLVCYRADHQAELARRQQEGWQPLLDWVMLRFDARFEVTSGVIPKAQPEATLKSIAAAVGEYPDLELTALHAITTASGSVVVGLALVEGLLDAASAFALSQLDESFQIEEWGEDAEAMKRRAGLEADIRAAARFLELLRTP